ncbi:uncharacterized protein LOC124894352, partial [Capsicum annuum]|uniref:uncharacterized protein LOC124894352 n=1 Tax=Capsicum annuum TaxID=4072 RepID=UPI001FB0CC0C
MGFRERFIEMICDIVNNNWYSVLVNGQPYGFFKSSRRVKQGDPLSPSLFILAEELIMEVLTKYEKASGQKVNKEKSAVYMHHLADPVVMERVQLVTGISRQEFPLTYLGCPIFYSKRNMSFYSDLIQKVLGRLQSWKGKLLSHGGRAVLICYVLQSMPIHLLSAVDPPDYVEQQLLRNILPADLAEYKIENIQSSITAAGTGYTILNAREYWRIL